MSKVPWFRTEGDTANKRGPFINITIIQIKPKDCEPAKNFALVEERIKLFKEEWNKLDNNVVVLPEYHLTGWCPDDPRFSNAIHESEKYLEKYVQLAKDEGFSIVPGTICHLADEPGKPHLNKTYFIEGGTGKILAEYSKKNLWHPERPHIQAGYEEPHLAFDTPFRFDNWNDGKPLRAGLLICWDLAFPEAFRALVKDGTHLIIVPACWNFKEDVNERALRMNPQCDKQLVNALVSARAYENGAVVAFCNTYGESCVSMPILGQGSKIEADTQPERPVVTAVDLDALTLAEENYKIREDMDREDWHYETSTGGNGVIGEGPVLAS